MSYHATETCTIEITPQVLAELTGQPIPQHLAIELAVRGGPTTHLALAENSYLSSQVLDILCQNLLNRPTAGETVCRKTPPTLSW